MGGWACARTVRIAGLCGASRTASPPACFASHQWRPRWPWSSPTVALRWSAKRWKALAPRPCEAGACASAAPGYAPEDCVQAAALWQALCPGARARGPGPAWAALPCPSGLAAALQRPRGPAATAAPTASARSPDGGARRAEATGKGRGSGGPITAPHSRLSPPGGAQAARAPAERGARRGPRLATLGPGDARWEARPGGYGPTGRGASSCPPRCRGLGGCAASRGRGGRRGRRQHTLGWGPRAPRRAPHRGSRRCSCGCDVSGWPRVPCRLSPVRCHGRGGELVRGT